MTKLSLAKYMKQIKGTLSKTLITFRTWKERQVLEDYPKPTYTRTSKQDVIRSWYKKGCEEWKKLSADQKASYEEKANKLGLTAFNVFMSEWLKLLKGVFKYDVTINNTQLNQTLTDYQIKLTITNNATFFNDFNNDHKYLEVYDTDQATQLSFYVEKWDTTNKNAVIWIKVPSIPASGVKNIYLKYNPTRLSYLSNPYAVFDFYDVFPGSSLDTTKWESLVASGGITVSNGICRLSTSCQIRSKTSLSGSFQFELIINIPSGVNCYRQRTYLYDVNNNRVTPFDHGYFSSNNITVYIFWNAFTTTVVPVNTDLTVFLRFLNGVFYWTVYKPDGTILYQNSTSVSYIPVKVCLGVGDYPSTTNPGTLDVKMVRAYKYVSPAPTLTLSRIV
jgi:hypothetical protein